MPTSADRFWIGVQEIAPVTFPWPWVLSTPCSDVVPVAPPLTRTVPLSGTAGASLSRLSRSMPAARASAALSRSRTRANNRMEPPERQRVAETSAKRQDGKVRDCVDATDLL